MKYCYECGEKIGEKDKRCPKCGIKLQRVDEKMTTGTKVIIALLSVLVIPALLCCASVFAYIFMSDDPSDAAEGIRSSLSMQNAAALLHGQITPSPAAQPSPSPSPEPKLTPAILSTPAALPAETDYKVYTDSEFGFSCAYPADFVMYNDNTITGRYTAKSRDGTAEIKICASDNSSDTTAAKSLAAYKSKYGGVTESENSTSGGYTVKLRNGSKYYYKCLKLKNGNMYWFELEYFDKDKAVYDEYIKYIYKSFTIK